MQGRSIERRVRRTLHRRERLGNGLVALGALLVAACSSSGGNDAADAGSTSTGDPPHPRPGIDYPLPDGGSPAPQQSDCPAADVVGELADVEINPRAGATKIFASQKGGVVVTLDKPAGAGQKSDPRPLSNGRALDGDTLWDIEGRALSAGTVTTAALSSGSPAKIVAVYQAYAYVLTDEANGVMKRVKLEADGA